MNASASRVGFIVALPSDYMDQIEEAVTDELKVAQQKWGVKLSPETQERVREHSINQLVLKVDSALKTTWEFKPEISLKIKGLTKGSGGFNTDLNIPEDADKLDGIRLILAREGYEVDDEDSDGSLNVTDLPTRLLEAILKWLRTAIFYGVGSYKV